MNDNGTTCTAAAANRGHRNNAGERIKLDVGGTIFHTSIATLTGCSAYFQSKFSVQWGFDESDGDYLEDNVIFVDQNPEPFKVLLAYMREGCVDCRKLTRNVLLQAEFLGIDTLLSAVKYRCYANKFPEFSGGANEVIDAYNQRYGDMLGGIIAGVLPLYLKKRDERKEFALLGKSAGRFILQGPKKLYDDDGEFSSESGLVPICSTFLDCLNWLGMNGFTKVDCPECVLHDGIRRIFFSRKLLNSGEDNHWDRVIIDNEGADREPDKKQYATLTVEVRSAVLDTGGVGMLREVARIDADIGKTSEIEISGRTETTSISKVAGINEATSVSCMNWLQHNGYTRREVELEDFYNSAQNVQPEKKVSIYSRIPPNYDDFA
mmetsp:Transcript_29217/g.42890  ORF Transcript_29217/g.42890 Transcript_29217/m.42890 type:complete len:378 (-) Transcript_29217:231-1364(-)